MRRLTESKYGIATLTNSEIYCLISDYLGCGGLGAQLIENEKLYISHDESANGYYHSKISFLFLSTLPIICEEQKEGETSISIGFIDLQEDEFYVKTTQVGSSVINATNKNLNTNIINEILKSNPNSFNNTLSYFYENFINLINKIDFNKRKKNELFNFYWDSPIPKEIKLKIEFENFDEFNGEYYLIAKPYSNNEKEEKVISVINNFIITDNRNDDFFENYNQERIECYSEFINSNTYKLYTEGKIETPFIEIN